MRRRPIVLARAMTVLSWATAVAPSRRADALRNTDLVEVDGVAPTALSRSVSAG